MMIRKYARKVAKKRLEKKILLDLNTLKSANDHVIYCCSSASNEKNER